MINTIFAIRNHKQQSNMRATDIYEKAKNDILDFLKYEIEQIYEVERRMGAVEDVGIDKCVYELDPSKYDVEIGTVYFCGDNTSYDEAIYALDSDSIIIRRYENGLVYLVDDDDNDLDVETDFPMESIVIICDAIEKVYHNVISK